MKILKVLLVEDQQFIVSAMALLLNQEPDIDIVATANGGIEAQQLVSRYQPDVVITDIEMPKGDGLSLARWLLANHPCKVLILTTFARPGYLQSALKAGVHGYVLKDMPAEDLAKQLRLIAQGAQVIDPSLTQEALAFRSPLNTRELALLRLIADGHTAKQAAEQLHIAHGTARNYLSEAMQKLLVNSRQAAINKAQELGLL